MSDDLTGQRSQVWPRDAHLPDLATRPLLYVMVGLPRSGKTRAAWTLSGRAGIPVVNPDSIRLALHGQRYVNQAEPFVWAIAKAMVRALFIAGHRHVIVDATNTTRRRRDEWRDDAWDIAFCMIDTPADECIRRAQAEDDAEIIAVIERMAAAFEPLSSDEPRA